MEDNVNISDIIKALQVIKNVCKENSSCTKCPFYTRDVCKIKYSDPEDWDIESNYIWRAFK